MDAWRPVDIVFIEGAGRKCGPRFSHCERTASLSETISSDEIVSQFETGSSLKSAHIDTCKQKAIASALFTYSPFL